MRKSFCDLFIRLFDCLYGFFVIEFCFFSRHIKKLENSLKNLLGVSCYVRSAMRK